MNGDVQPAVAIKRLYLTRGTLLVSIVVFSGFVLTI
jgi:hypothetical protein